MVQKEMMVFYVAEEINSGRMGTPHAYCVAFDGVSSYSHDMENLPVTFQEITEFLKKNILTVIENSNVMFFYDVIMETLPNDTNIKMISDFKFADHAYLGAGNFGYSLGQLTVNVKVNNE